MKNNDDFNYYGNPDDEYSSFSDSSLPSRMPEEDLDEILEKDLDEMLKNYIREKKLLKIKNKI